MLAASTMVKGGEGVLPLLALYLPGLLLVLAVLLFPTLKAQPGSGPAPCAPGRLPDS